jgi:hypothetical protein
VLQYTDKQFWRDPHFSFQVFGVCQKRQVCHASVLEIKTGSFIQHQKMLTTITVSDLIKASQEETCGVPFSNLAV